MGRKPVPQPLTLPTNSAASAPSEDKPRSAGEPLQGASPSVDLHSPPTSSRSPLSKFSPNRSHAGSLQSSPIPPTGNTSRTLDDYDDDDDDGQDSQQYPPITSALHQPLDTPARPHRQSQSQSQPLEARGSQPQHREEPRPSRSNFLAHFSKASSRSFSRQQPHHQHHHSESRAESLSRGTDTSGVASYKSAKQSDTAFADPAIRKPSPSLPSRSDLSLTSAGDLERPSSSISSSKNYKPKAFGLLHRTRSIRDKDNTSPKDLPQQGIPSPATVAEPERALTSGTHSLPLRTAPLGAEKSFRGIMTSAVRNRSEDRPPALPPRDQGNSQSRLSRDPYRPQPIPAPRSDSAGFFGGLRNSSTKAADMISKGLFGKSMRSGSMTEREPIIDDENYVLKVINLPLVKQVRKTRISKRLEDSKDKTEFWMPAFPWRAIDYLNYNGCEVEGLYRVPGSGPQIKKWQRRFDEEYDVDLFQQNDLYDINIVGSMLKAWLRELPDELFPKAAQDRIVRECAGSETVPQMLIDELSNLTPYNYYLLFAITCHLSLLLANSETNKMDFRNLCICFQPCMKIDAFCFKFLVCDWRDCWKGCNQESKFIQEEYSLFEQDPPKNVGETPKPSRQESSSERRRPVEDRAISSSDSSQKSMNGNQRQQNKGHTKRKPVPQPVPQVSDSNGNLNIPTPKSATLTLNGERPDADKAQQRDLRPLSPIQPLSPLGFS